ncbi:GAF domain-containing protein [Streptosporangium sp. NPDC006013]|uniref:GAF domain-containing protein n=1 Tax=Streptosporangium sp. NPDC006013 TaxID=3155596 RepID=UPI0033A47455
MADGWDDGGGPDEKLVERFLDGKLTGNDVRAVTLHSWRRCQEAGLTPSTVQPHLLGDLDFDCGVVRAARPVFERLRTVVEGTPVSMFLGDASGVMFLRNEGEPALRRTLDAVGAAPGFRFAEADMGTNAFGSALVERRICQVTGNEHFAEELRGLTGVAAPIRHPLSGRVNGVISVVGPNDTANAEMMVLARRSAAAVERRLFEMAAERERALMEEFLRAPNGGVATASTPLDLCRRDRLALEDAAVRLVAQGRAAVVKTALSDGRTATLEAQPIIGSTAIAVKAWLTDGQEARPNGGR